jgi:hypothetical protein
MVGMRFGMAGLVAVVTASSAGGCTAPLLGTAAGCGSTGGRAVAVNVETGTVNGVRLGDSSERAVALLGEPTSRSTGGVSPEPTRCGYTGPVIIHTPVAPGTSGKPPQRPLDLHWPHLAAVASQRRIYALLVSGNAVEPNGLRVGGRLDDVRRLRPDFHCGTTRSTESTPYAYCYGRVGRTWAWYGGDPIRTIAVTSTTIGG